MFSYTDNFCKLWMLSQFAVLTVLHYEWRFLFWKQEKSSCRNKQFLWTRPSYWIEAAILVEMERELYGSRWEAASFNPGTRITSAQMCARTLDRISMTTDQCWYTNHVSYLFKYFPRAIRFSTLSELTGNAYVRPSITTFRRLTSTIVDVPHS